MLNSSQRINPEVKNALKKISHGEIDNEVYKVIYRHQTDSPHAAGINPEKVADALELKIKAAFLPDSLAYSLARPGRGDYLIANCHNPSVCAVDNNEVRYLDALHAYYQNAADYKVRIKELSVTAREILDKMYKSSYYGLDEEQEKEVLIDLLLDREIERSPLYSNTGKYYFLMKYDLFDAYHLDDNVFTLKWKVGEILESKGLLDKGATKLVFEDAGIAVHELKENLDRYKVDKLRVSDVEILKENGDASAYIRCKIDNMEQPGRKLSSHNTELLGQSVNALGIGVKYYTDVLDKNRKEGKAIADEKTLARLSMPSVERLIEIYKHGMNEQDIFLARVSRNVEVDSLLRNSMLLEMENESVDAQKHCAFSLLSDYIEDIRPGMLMAEEVIQLAKEAASSTLEGREEENFLMRIPEVFFPIVERTAELDKGALAYTKVMRDIGRITPSMAYDSMCYYLTYRLYPKWDPTGSDDEYGGIAGCYFYPNENMKNPAEVFPPNLLNEQQWDFLSNRYNVKAPFIPETAFRENRIKDVQIYSVRDGGVDIRCVVDGEQQRSKRLSEEDAARYRGDVNRKVLALEYFMDAFAIGSERDNGMKR
ncbi:hypothetical protein [Bacteroides cellulosilyticus]|jgi:hypothetical protein|uniref:hypothetical protein n=1 Tax=Bacteroides cellulosilyticus TaxID=246787 RepID=UPI0022E38F02|nr:hypothetical protein [Bacteroides cellulosilyticus]